MLNDIKKLIKNNHGMSLIEILISLTLMGIAGTFVAGKVYENLQ